MGQNLFTLLHFSFPNFPLMTDLQIEQLQEDIICIMESNYGETDYVNDVINQLIQAVLDNNINND